MRTRNVLLAALLLVPATTLAQQPAPPPVVPAAAMDAAPAAPAALDAAPVAPVTALQDGGTSVKLPDIEKDTAGFFNAAWQAFNSKNWKGLAALALIALVWLIRKFGAKVSWLASDRGGAVLVMVMAFLTVFATALGSGAKITGGVVLNCAYLAFIAAGAWTWTKKILGKNVTNWIDVNILGRLGLSSTKVDPPKPEPGK